MKHDSKIIRTLSTLLLAGALCVPVVASAQAPVGVRRDGGSRVVRVGEHDGRDRARSYERAERRAVAPAAPPAPRREVRPPRPARSATWANGSWQWNGGRYVWQPGRWVVARHAVRPSPRPLPPRRGWR